MNFRLYVEIVWEIINLRLGQLVSEEGKSNSSEVSDLFGPCKLKEQINTQFVIYTFSVDGKWHYMGKVFV